MLNAVYTHWCYQCSEQFGPVEGEPVCPYCNGGFVEQLSTVQDSTLPNSEDDSTQQMPDLFDLNSLMRSPDLFDLNALMRSPDLRFEIMDVVDAFMSWRVPGRNPNFDVRGRSGLFPDQNWSVVGPRIGGQCNEPTTTGASEFLGHHGVSALAHDLFHPEINSQVPEGLSNHVVSSKRAQANWYIKLLEAWRAAQPPPETPEEAARLVIETLKTNQKADVEGLLAFYGLPLPHTLVQLTAGPPTSLPAGVQYEFQTLPVDARAIVDGDGFTVYVNTTDPRESSCVPIDVQVAAVQRSEVCAEKNYSTADAIHDIIINSGYRVIKFQNSEEILARKYRIRLRGIDAPENSMPYGQEAKEELTKIVQGKCLRVLVYGEDQYGRCISDLYCNGKFVQELMLKKGLVWHYAVYDQRPELATWEKEARARRVGLWASSNPEKPWEWRKNNPR